MSDTIVTALMVLARALHYGAALVLFGYCVFRGYLLQAADTSGAPGARRTAQVLAIVLAVSSLLWLAAEAANAGDGIQDAVNPGIMWDVLTSTSIGKAWIVQIVLALLLLVTAFLPGGPRLRTGAWLSALVLIGLGATGHAVMFEGTLQWLLPIIQALHLLAGGFWIGGLLAIATRPNATGPQWRDALMSFSFIGHVAVAVVVFSGVLIGMIILFGQAASWNLAYLAALLCKAALVAVMAGFALYNRYYLVPRIGRVPGSDMQLMQVVRLNLLLSAMVVLLVSLLGILAPSNA